MFCGNCGKEIDNNAKFCRYCGKPVVAQRATPPPQYAPPPQQSPPQPQYSPPPQYVPPPQYAPPPPQYAPPPPSQYTQPPPQYAPPPSQYVPPPPPQPAAVVPTTSSKSKGTAAVLTFFLGWLGMHRFYVGKKGSATLMLLLTIAGSIVYFIARSGESNMSGSFGLIFSVLGIWLFIDFITILVGKFRDGKGLPLK